MISQLSADFAAQSPLVALDVRMTGSSDGAVLFCDALVPITGSSRPFNERELASCASSGIAFTRLLVARDAVALMVDAGSTAVQCLTQEQIYALMGPESVSVSRWSEAGQVIDGAGIGLPNEDLTVVGPGAGSGTRQTLIDLAIAPLAKERDATPALRPDYVIEPAEQLIRSSMLNHQGALGFAGLATASGWAQTLRLLSVDFGQGCQRPSSAAINSGDYPLSRELYVYVNLAAVAGNPTELAFVDQLVSSEGLATAERVGSVALTDQERAAVRAHWEAARDQGTSDSA